MDRSNGKDRQSRLLAIIAVSVVRPSFERCCASGDRFFDTFYADLAARLPGVGALFAHTDMRKQNALVRDGIDALIQYAEGVPEAQDVLTQLGALHGRNQLNIRPELYAGWVDSLTAAIARFDRRYDQLIEAAWREVLADGIEFMVSFY